MKNERVREREALPASDEIVAALEYLCARGATEIGGIVKDG